MRRVGVADEAKAVAVAKLTSRSDPQAVADYAGDVMALDLRTQLTAIHVPVLEIEPYLAGDHAGTGVSEAAKRAYYRSLLAGVAQLDVVTIAPARHFVMLDPPLAFNDTVAKFLAAPALR